MAGLGPTATGKLATVLAPPPKAGLPEPGPRGGGGKQRTDDEN